MKSLTWRQFWCKLDFFWGLARFFYQVILSFVYLPVSLSVCSLYLNWTSHLSEPMIGHWLVPGQDELYKTNLRIIAVQMYSVSAHLTENKQSHGSLVEHLVGLGGPRIESVLRQCFRLSKIFLFKSKYQIFVYKKKSSFNKNWELCAKRPLKQ